MSIDLGPGARMNSHRGPSDGGFRHDALLYNGSDEFVDTAARFIRGGLAAEEPILVVVSAEKIALLREELGSDAAEVDFRDMDTVGSNPARIIPAWYDFVASKRTERCDVRGIGEPISASRDPESLIECQRHESLLNLAFADSRWWLVCPYDTSALDDNVIEEALRSHPFVSEQGVRRTSDTYLDLERISKPFDAPLPPPRGQTWELGFSQNELHVVREGVAAQARHFGLESGRVEDLVVAVNEVATNSVRHGGGRGALRAWTEGPSFICEIKDSGRLDQPLVGRRRPEAGQEGGFGMWLVHQLCDLVQIRTFSHGSVVRMYMSRRMQPADQPV